MIRPEDIRELLRRQTFQSFRIHVSNGQSFDVVHPELALVTRGTIYLARPSADPESNIGEGVHMISVLHINNVEVMPSPAAAKKG